MASKFLAACIQLNSKRDIELNFSEIFQLLDKAIGKGADFITFPECTGMMEPDHDLLKEKAPFEQDHKLLVAIREKAIKGKVWILIGSLAIRLFDNRIVNRSYLIDEKGNIAATYDKIHMFDVKLDANQVYRESEAYKPGSRAVLVNLPWGRLGLTICYDIRFAYLYRTLAQNGADFITIPAAFTKISGEAHWHILQRARAIETGCYIISAAQCGTHAEGRETYGHSLIVDPWGKIMADGGKGIGLILAEIDPDKVNQARTKIPSLSHDRNFDLSQQMMGENKGNRADTGH